MTGYTSIDVAKEILGDHLIGLEELRKTGFFGCVENNKEYEIPFTVDQIQEKAHDYLLIRGVSQFKDGTLVTIRNLIHIFGKNPDVSEPCFYNQDWYEAEEFIDSEMKDEWFFIRKSVYENSRAIQPQELSEKYQFPTAVKCSYAFFMAWLSRGIQLWYHDFVWCSDKDHNGDRIYVGKYHDVDGRNKNGFSIHRHLALRPCYGCID